MMAPAQSSPPVQSSQRGAALITVLMIVAAMSVVALGLTQVVTTATQRARALDGQAQLRLYAVAAEEVAEARLSVMLATLDGRLVADMPGLDEAQLIPVDGGTLSVRAVDASNCFDLNRLVTITDSGTILPVPEVVADYVIMLEAAGFDTSQAQALAASVTDWMDSDSSPGLGGGEDGFYAGEQPAYRTSRQPLASLTELRAIRGYDGATVVALRPVICVRPTGNRAADWKLNLNTLTQAQAPILVLAFSGALTPEDARRVIAARPLGGWPDVESFLDQPAITSIAPEARRLDLLGMVSTHLEVQAEISYRGQVMSMQYLFETLPGQPVRTLWRERVG